MTAAFVPAPEDPFAVAVRAGIRSAGLTLRQLERTLKPYGELSSSIATLSDWGKGRFHPTPGDQGRGRVLALERCLGLPAGDLLLLLPSTPTTYPTRSTVGKRSRDRLTERRDDLLAQVGRRVGPQKVIPVAHLKEYALGFRLAPVLATVTSTVRALHDGVDRYLFVHAPDPRLHPLVVPQAGCVDMVEHREAPAAGLVAGRVRNRLVVVELRFDRTLSRGDTHTFSYTIGYSAEDAAPVLCEPVFRHVQAEPCERLELRLSVQPDWRLSDVRECYWPKPRDLDRERSVTVRDGQRSYLQRHADPVPAGYGWRWRALSPRDLGRTGGPTAA